VPLNPASNQTRKGGKEKKSITNQRPVINPTGRVKSRRGSRRKPQRKRPFFDNLLCSISLESSDIDFTAPQKEGINTINKQRKTQSHLLFVRRLFSPLVAQLNPQPAAMEALTATDKCFSPARGMSPMPIVRSTPLPSPEAAW
jgi:hypothetical protein